MKPSFMRSLFISFVFGLIRVACIQLKHLLGWKVQDGIRYKAFSWCWLLGGALWFSFMCLLILQKAVHLPYMTFSRQQKQKVQVFLKPSLASCTMLLLPHSLGQSKLRGQSRFTGEVDGFYIWTERAVGMFQEGIIHWDQYYSLSR